jgi:signal transduction histidine kinase
MKPLSKNKLIKNNITTGNDVGPESKQAEGYEKQSIDQPGYLSILSHEIRTPLATICSSADLIQIINSNKQNKDKKNNDLYIKEHAIKIRDTAFRIIELLDNVMMVNKADSGNFTYSPVKMEMEAFINEIIERVKINYVVIPEIKTVFNLKEKFCVADGKLMGLIFSNLISNAIKFSGEKESVYIKLTLSDSVVEFYIKNTGIGICEEDKLKLFEPFFRGSNTENISGNGLGLYIVKKAVELHNGRISFKSRLNYGTSFLVYIPVNNEK